MERKYKNTNHSMIVEMTSATPHEYKSEGEGIIIHYGIADSPFGKCFIAGSENGICTFQFCDESYDILVFELKKEWKKSTYREDNLFAKAIAEKIFYSDNNSTSIKLWLKGTTFQFKVWKTLLREVTKGSVVSYRKLAQLTGYPNAVRAVASAVARNPVGYIIPCHRVIRSDGNIGQYHWKPERKAAIIEWEK